MKGSEMKVGIYARVSTQDKHQDPELQLRDLRAFCQARGWTIAGEYVDIGQSGSKDSRPQLNRLLDDVRKRKVDCVCVWRLDRFSRSLKNLIITLDEFASLGISFVSYGENLDFTTSTGKLLFHLLGAFAEFERNLIRERVKAGLANTKAKGTILGRPKAGIDRGKLLELQRQGHSVRAIAQTMKVSKSLVHKTLKELGAGTSELPRGATPLNQCP